MPRFRTASLRATFAVALGAAVGASPAMAAPIEPVGAVARTTETPSDGGRVDHSAVPSGAMYFVTDVPGGSELWKTDGTDGGSTRVRSLPVPGGTHPASITWLPAAKGPAEVVATSSRLFFVLQDGLWTSDGTADGTQRVLENTDSIMDDLAVVGERVIVRRQLAASGASETFWGSDGTPGGTEQVYDGGWVYRYGNYKRVDAGPYTYFQRSSLGMSDGRIYRSDGTAAGTVPYGPSIETGEGPRAAAGALAGAFEGQPITLLQNRVTIGDGPGARTITFGTSATDRVAVHGVYRGPGDLLFIRANHLGADGIPYTPSTLYRVAADNKPQLAQLLGGPEDRDAGGEHVRFGNTFVFTVKYRSMLFITPNDPPDNPGASVACSGSLADSPSLRYTSGIRELTVVGRWLYFVAETASTGSELWRTDGTRTGAELVEDLVPGAGSSAPGPITRLGNQLLFSAIDAAGVRRQYRLSVDPSGTGPDGVAGCPFVPEPSGKGYTEPEPDPPGQLTIRAGKSHDGSAPYRWAISGRLSLPSGSTPVFACEGSVTVTVKRGRRVVAKTKVKVFPMKSTCGYQVPMRVKSKALARRGTLSVKARYNGYRTLLPTSSRSMRLTYGAR